MPIIPRNWRHGITPNGILLARGVLVAFSFSAVLSLFQLALPLYSMQIFDRVLPSDSIPSLVTLSLLMVGITGCSVAIDAARSTILGRIAERIDRNLHHRALAMAMGGTETSTSALKDVENVRSFIAGPIATALLELPWVIIFLLAIFLLHPLLGGLTAIAALLMLVVGTVSYIATRGPRSQTAVLSGSITEALRNAADTAETSAAMGMQSKILKHLIALRREACRGSTIAAERQAWIEAVGRGLRTVLQLGILATSSWLVLSGSLQTGAIVATSMLFARALGPVERLSTSIHIVHGFYIASRRAGVLAYADRLGEKVFSPPAITGSVVADDISLLSVDRKRVILKRVNLSLHPGEVVVVVGREGAGKSSLAKVLTGAVKPTNGTVRMDGFSMSEFDPDVLGPQIGFLPGTDTVLHGSVASIISRGDEPDTAKIVKAAQLAGLHSTIQALPLGYKTELDRNNCFLSSGQRQRLTLARAFYGIPHFIVLDEPTACLDDNGEVTLLAAVRELKAAGCTIVIVSRFPALLHLADRLLMLENGAIKFVANQTEMQQFIAPRLATSKS